MAGDLPSTSNIPPNEIQRIFRENQKLRVTIDKLITVLGLDHAASREAQQVLAGR